MTQKKTQKKERYINVTGVWKLVKADTVVNELGLDLFIHRPFGKRIGWVVTEAQTGMRLSPVISTQDVAILKSIQRLERYEQENGPGSLSKFIAQRISVGGLSPDYR